jgi:hypothetical protein
MWASERPFRDAGFYQVGQADGLRSFEPWSRKRLRGAREKPSSPPDCHARVALAGRRASCNEGHRLRAKLNEAAGSEGRSGGPLQQTSLQAFRLSASVPRRGNTLRGDARKGRIRRGENPKGERQSERMWRPRRQSAGNGLCARFTERWIEK